MAEEIKPTEESLNAEVDAATKTAETATISTSSKIAVILASIGTFFKNLPSKISGIKTMSTWKKVLIIIVILLITHGSVGLGLYIAGTKTCKPTEDPSIGPTNPKPTNTITDKTDAGKAALQYCGNISASMSIDKKYKVKVIAKNRCDTYTGYYQVDMHCPNPLWSVNIGLGLLTSYDVEGKKFYVQPGGIIGFQRHYGNFSFGPEIAIYSSIDKTMVSGAANLKIEYRF